MLGLSQLQCSGNGTDASHPGRMRVLPDDAEHYNSTIRTIIDSKIRNGRFDTTIKLLIRRRTRASHTLKLDAQWGERTSVDIRNSAHARC